MCGGIWSCGTEPPLPFWLGDPDIINGFALGASSVALFARVGGVFTPKLLMWERILVGKVEAGIPEDDLATRQLLPTT